MQRDSASISDSTAIACLPSGSLEQEARNAGSSVMGPPVDGNEEDRVIEFLREVQKRRPRLLWVAARMLGGEQQEAEDIVQEALMRAFKNLGRFRAESQMSTWLQAIVKNAVREHLRNWGGRRFVSLDLDPWAEEDSCECDLPDPGPNPEEDCERREREQIAHRAIVTMGPTNRRTVELCIFEEMPYMEVATLLNVSAGTIKARMFRSRRELRNVITDLIAPLK